MILVIGIDGATWKIISPNIKQLPTLKHLCKVGNASTITVEGSIKSAPLWCSMFSGKTPEEHGHLDFIDTIYGDRTIRKRNDIHVDFIWDILKSKDYDVVAINIPFVIPPFTIGSAYKSVGFGLPMNPEEWQQELDQLSAVVSALLEPKPPDVLIAVYTILDRIQHLHWGEPVVLDWYKQVDIKLGILVEQLSKEDKLIVVSDHGFCSFGEAREKTLPEITSTGDRIKGDHHEEAILITKNVNYKIERTIDIFNAIHFAVEGV